MKTDITLTDAQIVTLRQLGLQREPMRVSLWHAATLRALFRRGLVSYEFPRRVAITPLGRAVLGESA